jgi:GT2 family glycosyltransferase
MLTQKEVTLVIPAYNNLRHLKNAYDSIKRNAPEVKIILLDDGSTDGTFEWLKSLELDKQISVIYRSEERVGHTILYDKGIALAHTPVVGILHADMIIGPNYVENMLKHLKSKTVVCGTRIEPPLHPEGKEKIIQDFGMDFDSLNIKGFEEFASTVQIYKKDNITKGMFAPWILYKKDFDKVGGHDKIFAPFPYEDSDIFQRWMLAGYELIQSRDALVYHLTCRGHRWTDKIGLDDTYFQNASNKSAKNYLRKWGSWIKNDEYQLPIIPKKYDIGIVLQGSSYNTLLMDILEPWCSNIYMSDEDIVSEYIKNEQPNTLIDLKNKFKINQEPTNDVLLVIHINKFDNESFKILTDLQDVINQQGEIGDFRLGDMILSIRKMDPIEIPIQPLFPTT